jgi:hypothetical protein
MHHIQEYVNWWCNLLGVVDPASVQIASGIVAGGSLLLVAFYVIFVILYLVSTLVGRQYY